MKRSTLVHPVVSAGILGAILGSLIMCLIFGYLLAWGPTARSTFNTFLVGFLLYLPVSIVLGAYLGCLGWWLKFNHEKAIFWMAFLSIPIIWYSVMPILRLLRNRYPSGDIWIIRIREFAPDLFIGLIVESILLVLAVIFIQLVKKLTTSAD
jgi:hypothetical protein